MNSSPTTQFPVRKGAGPWARLLYGVLTVVFGALGAGAVALLAQFQILTTELAGTRRELAATQERVARLERRLEEGPVDQAFRQLPGARGRPTGEEEQLQPPLQLSREEVQVVKDYIKVPPAPPGATNLIKQGAVVPIGALAPLPSQITDKLPKLLGARFMTDNAGAIVIVRRGSRSADAIITSY